MGLIGGLIRLITGAGGLAEQFRRAYEAKLEATTDTQRLAADLDLQRITAAIEMARIANEDRWSATSLGRYLIVLPFGAWWAAIYFDSIFSFEWDVLAVPPLISEMALWLIPAIVAGDVGRSLFAGMRRR